SYLVAPGNRMLPGWSAGRREVQIAQHASQARAVHAEQLGGTPLIAAAASERGPDQARLVPQHQLRERGLAELACRRTSRGQRAGEQRLRQAQASVATHHERPLDQLAELADVPRPIVTLECCQGLGWHLRDRPAESSTLAA